MTTTQTQHTHTHTEIQTNRNTNTHTCMHANILLIIYIYNIHITYIFYTCIEIYNHTLPDLTLSVHCATLPYHTITLHYNITLHYMMLHDTLHCVIALPYIPFHYLTSPYITVHSTTVPRFFSYVPPLFHNSSTTVPIWTVDYIHLTLW